MNPWLSRRVIGWAHQGGPENDRPPGTVETMQHALSVGMHALEFDLHLTGDDPRRLVVHHDPVLVAGGVGREIATTTLEILRHAMPELATLEDVLSAVPKEVPMTVEVKPRGSDAAQAVVGALAAEVGLRPLIITSFSSATVRAARKKAGALGVQLDTAPGLPILLCFWLLAFSRLPIPMARKHVALQVPLRLDQVRYAKGVPLLRRLKVCTAHFVRAAHKQGLAVHVWTLDTESEMNDALNAKADGIMTNCPTDLMAILLNRGSWQG